MKFDRGKIFKTAWQIYRRVVPAGTALDRASFAGALRAAWALAKSPRLAPDMFVAQLRDLIKPVAAPVPVYRGARFYSRESLRLRASFGA